MDPLWAPFARPVQCANDGPAARRSTRLSNASTHLPSGRVNQVATAILQPIENMNQYRPAYPVNSIDRVLCDAMSKGADILVAALENEGVERIFGIPGEENLDVVESIRKSSIQLVLTRHEQAAAFMAATYGRLTGKPGVCITTLGPGALNLTTGAAYALLGAMPMVMITGQKGVLSSRQARFQIVDVVAAMRPLTKLSRQIVSPNTIATLVREAFRVAEEERPGPVHLELPEDIAAEESEAVAMVPPHSLELPIANAEAIARASSPDHERQGAPPDARRCRLPTPLNIRPRAVCPANEDPVFHDADGEGHRARRHGALHRDSGPVRTGLRARCHRASRSHCHHRPRHR